MTAPDLLTSATSSVPSGGAARPTGPLVEVRDLSVAFGDRTVVRDVSFTLEPGRCVAIVGESGSGKSVTARSLLGLNGPSSSTTAAALSLGGRDLRDLSDRAWRGVRGKDVGYVLQDALVSLDPLRRVGASVADALRAHGVGPRSAREQQVLSLLGRVGIPSPSLRARQLPSELSGGLRQRALIAAAIALDPAVLIADEPTTALDTTVQAQILALLDELRAGGTGLVLISHDLGVVEQFADEVVVMQHGVVVEQGSVAAVLGDPQHAYTKRLLAAIPSAHAPGARLSDAPPATLAPRPASRPVPVAGSVVLSVSHVSKRYRGPDGVVRTVVDDVSFELRAGETLGIVGESGSGKSTTAAIALALTPPSSGQVLFEGRPWSVLAERARRADRPRIATVSQDPLSSFDPRRTVGELVRSALVGARSARAVDAAGPPRAAGTDAARVDALLQGVGLDPSLAGRHPLTLSGGQRQRVAIARALATDPDVLVLDEAVSALDVSVQAQVLDLLADIRREYGTAALFISHDLGVIHHVSDRVLVLRDGRVVEEGPADQVFRSPSDPYTQGLLDAVPGVSVHRDPRTLQKES
ncbi:ABC transporter ATP-binding protein [Curtobacterium sp. MCLR17_007]|uniref:dipeptide ABC transporter ATP-binding protein n=1 Tax=Curtobacterium sp. MCLR17_007 TaxID=2175648 RepID=UPI0021ABF07D|nr:ABC transporter ATP-binding protein [Curtobacterium sp. MCLR17_007]WIB60498.1 ABC transporter ATP-binding protein [Curtobacterium sp. MCLR17_007]